MTLLRCHDPRVPQAVPSRLVEHRSNLAARLNFVKNYPHALAAHPDMMEIRSFDLRPHVGRHPARVRLFQRISSAPGRRARLGFPPIHCRSSPRVGRADRNTAAASTARASYTSADRGRGTIGSYGAASSGPPDGNSTDSRPAADRPAGSASAGYSSRRK